MRQMPPCGVKSYGELSAAGAQLEKGIAMGRFRVGVVAVLTLLLAIPLAGCASYGGVDMPEATGGKPEADAAKAAAVPSKFALDFSQQDVSDADAAAEEYPYEAKSFKKGTHYSAVSRMDEAPHQKQTSCLSCKSAAFLGVVNDGGAQSSYGQDFSAARGVAGVGMTCFSCHADTPGTLRITNRAFAEGLGEEAKKVDVRSLACMQCHAESYVDAKTGETRFPYKYGFDPESVLKYYDEIGHSDSVDPKTGAKLLFVEHGQGESFVGGSHFAKGVDCADCHTMKVTTPEGDEYTDHAFVMSMETPEVMTDKCLKGCHKGKTVDELSQQVRGTEVKGTARMQTARSKVDAYHTALVEAVAGKRLSPQDLEQAQTLYRHADFYTGLMFDSPLAEGNGNLFHNNMLLNENAKKAEELAQKGMELLGK